MRPRVHARLRRASGGARARFTEVIRTPAPRRCWSIARGSGLSAGRRSRPASAAPSRLELTVGADGQRRRGEGAEKRRLRLRRSRGRRRAEVPLSPRRPTTASPSPRRCCSIRSSSLRPHLSAETTARPPPPAATRRCRRRRPRRPSVRVARWWARGPISAASSSTIRNLDLDLRPMTAPNDILRVVPGLLTVQHQGGGKADQLFLRGFDADHGTDVAIYVDGVPVNMPSHAHGQGYADLHWLIPEAVERIDVVKGPYDARFGDFATAGAVNLITRERFDESSVQFTARRLSHAGLLGRHQQLQAGGAERFVGIAAPKLPGWAAKLHPWVAFEVARDQRPVRHRREPGALQPLRQALLRHHAAAPRSACSSRPTARAWIGSGPDSIARGRRRPAEPLRLRSIRRRAASPSGRCSPRSSATHAIRETSSTPPSTSRAIGCRCSTTSRSS